MGTTPTPPTKPSFNDKVNAQATKTWAWMNMHPMFSSGLVAFVCGFLLAKCT